MVWRRALLGLAYRRASASSAGLREFRQRLQDSGFRLSSNFRTRRALAESIIGLYKTEVIRRRGPWRGLKDVEFVTLEWVHWYNTQRLLEPIGNVPPVEYEMNYYQSQEGSLEMARLN